MPHRGQSGGRGYTPRSVEERREIMRMACLKSATELYIDMGLTNPDAIDPVQDKELTYEDAAARIVTAAISMADRLMNEEAGRKE